MIEIRTQEINPYNLRVVVDGETVGHLFHYTTMHHGWTFAALDERFPDGERYWPTADEALGEVRDAIVDSFRDVGRG